MEIRHTRLTGRVGAHAVIIDDILDTGATLLSACEKLVEAGVRDIFILVTHGLFTGPRWQVLWQLGVRRIACTDTVPLPAALDTTGIQIVSVLPLLQQQLVVLAGRDDRLAA